MLRRSSFANGALNSYDRIRIFIKQRFSFVDKKEILILLEEWNCDVKGALERFIDDEELYMTCLTMLTEDHNFEKLGIALKEKNTAVAFDCAHTLKGVVLNLGLTPMFSIAEQIVEPLRTGNVEHLEKSYKELLKENEKLKEILRIKN